MNSDSRRDPNSGGNGTGLIGSLLSLLLVAALVYGGYILYKKHVDSKKVGGSLTPGRPVNVSNTPVAKKVPGSTGKPRLGSIITKAQMLNANTNTFA